MNTRWSSAISPETHQGCASVFEISFVNSGGKWIGIKGLLFHSQLL